MKPRVSDTVLLGTLALVLLFDLVLVLMHPAQPCRVADVAFVERPR